MNLVDLYNIYIVRAPRLRRVDLQLLKAFHCYRSTFSGISLSIAHLYFSLLLRFAGVWLLHISYWLTLWLIGVSCKRLTSLQIRARGGVSGVMMLWNVDFIACQRGAVWAAIPRTRWLRAPEYGYSQNACFAVLRMPGLWKSTPPTLLWARMLSTLVDILVRWLCTCLQSIVMHPSFVKQTYMHVCFDFIVRNGYVLSFRPAWQKLLWCV